MCAKNGLIRVKEEGWTGFSKGWQGCSEGFSEGEARGKSRGAALPARGKPHPSRLFYSDLHSISNRFFEISVLAFLKCMDGSVLAFLKSIDGSVLALLNPYRPSRIRIGLPESVLALLNPTSVSFDTDSFPVEKLS